MIDPAFFVAIGEKIHCSRVYKSGGVKTVALDNGGEAIAFTSEGRSMQLPLPADWAAISPAYADGKIKHVAAAIHLALDAASTEQTVDAALNYLFALCDEQLAAGAAFLDLNVDEYSPDPQRCMAAMKWLAATLAVQFPGASFSIDSSNPEVLRAGLEAASANGRRHLLNSVSLERSDSLQLAVEFEADLMASAAGRTGLPSTVDERLANLDELLTLADQACIPAAAIHIDPLVLPLSTGSDHGRVFLDSVQAIRERFPEPHVSGGLSNVSFGMPRRRLLNAVFVRLAMEAGCDGGIIDPTETSPAEAAELDLNADAARLAADFLLGRDEYGMEFIQAHRDGRLDTA